MKSIKFFLSVAIVALYLTSCDTKTEIPESITVTTVIDFEDVKLNSDSIWNGADKSGSFYTKVASFNNNYNSTYFSWSGFACSSKRNTITPGYANQYSASAGSGALNSKKYALGYGTATLICDSNVYGNFSIKSLMITNSTYALLDMKNGSAYSKKFVTGDWFKVIITGYLNNAKTNTMEYYLADFRDGKTLLSNTWTKVETLTLGKVDKVTFSLDSSDKGQWGMNTPAYLCIDNIEFTQTISTK